MLVCHQKARTMSAIVNSTVTSFRVPARHHAEHGASSLSLYHLPDPGTRMEMYGMIYRLRSTSESSVP